MTNLLAVGLGGFLGAIARWQISGFVQTKAGAAFPLGTLVVNVVGCAAIGAILTLVQERGSFSPATRLFLVTGFLGALTTFSTFGHETLELLRVGRVAAAGLNVALNAVAGVGAVALGRFLAGGG